MDRNQRVQNKQKYTRKAHRPALCSPSDVITKLNKTKKTREQKTGQESARNTP